MECLRSFLKACDFEVKSLYFFLHLVEAGTDLVSDLLEAFCELARSRS